MIINWGLLLPAVVILLYPAERVLPRSMKLRSYDYLSDPAKPHRSRWWLWQPELWADAARLAFGAWLAGFAIETEAGESPLLRFVLIGALLAAGLCGQMPTRRERDKLLAPLGAVIAFLFVLMPAAVAVVTVVTAVLGMMAFRTFFAFFLTGSMAALAFGFLLRGKDPLVVLAAGLFFLPLLVAWMSNRVLQLAVRPQGSRVPTASPLK